MKWVTRSRVHVDRVACPWLIKRFVDSQAEFIFAAPDSVHETAVREGAIPFDVDGAELGHKGGDCSFKSIIAKYGLKIPALLALAEVVNAADTHALETNRFASGLEAVAQGFSLLFPDDAENLDKQYVVYDALYNFFRMECAAGK